jgi:DNA mismatch endonuclease, patch repair protein
MTDTLTAEQRSVRMSLIRGKDTLPELKLRKQLHRLGLRYRLHNSKLPGKPDLTFAQYKTVVFVHGCFWHRHLNCKIATTPKSNVEYWQAKFKRNVDRDKANLELLTQLGWRVFTVWECEVDSAAKLTSTAQKIYRQIRSVKA